MDFLCETALLTHGLSSVSQEDLRRAWDSCEAARGATLAWVDAGALRLGRLDEYLPFRERAGEVARIDCDGLEAALNSGASGALTASGTMAACASLGMPVAVTCGMGGIGDITGEELCPDLPALVRFPVALVATSPKDMLDIPATLGWLASHGVTAAQAGAGGGLDGQGRDTDGMASPDAKVNGRPMGRPARCTGYVFHSAEVPIDPVPEGGWTAEAVVRIARQGGLLLLNPIPESERVQDRSVLEAAVRAGHDAEAHGEYYHPAANREIDRLTEGASSLAQLRSIIANVCFAASL